MQIIVGLFVYVRIQCSIHLATETPRRIQSILLGLNVSKYEGCFIYLMTVTCHFPPSTWLVSWMGYIITIGNLTGRKWQPTTVRWNNDPALWLLSSGMGCVILYLVIMFSWNLHIKLHSVVYKKYIILSLSWELQILYFKIKFCYDSGKIIAKHFLFWYIPLISVLNK